MFESFKQQWQSITVVRTFKAPVVDVFRAWTDPAIMQKWLAPGPCTVVEAVADARVGGAYRFVVRAPDGRQFTTTGEYREVSPPTRIVKTWVFEGDNPPVTRYPTLLTVEFREKGPRSTEVRLLQTQLLRFPDRLGNRFGWASCLKKLAAALP